MIVSLLALSLLSTLPASAGSWGLEYRNARTPQRIERVLPLTPQDRLWMGRMLYGEVGTLGRRAYALVLYTVAQRLWFLPAYRRVDSFTTFMRKFSQPINPGFLDPNGRLCRKFPGSCREALLARRRRIQSMSWEDLPAMIRDTVDEFMSGELENPAPQSIDFARSYNDRDCISKGTRVLLRDPPGPPGSGAQHVYCRPRKGEQAPLVTVR